MYEFESKRNQQNLKEVNDSFDKIIGNYHKKNYKYAMIENERKMPYTNKIVKFLYLILFQDFDNQHVFIHSYHTTDRSGNDYKYFEKLIRYIRDGQFSKVIQKRGVYFVHELSETCDRIKKYFKVVNKDQIDNQVILMQYKPKKLQSYNSHIQDSKKKWYTMFVLDSNTLNDNK